MPDLKSELSKVINSWETPTAPEVVDAPDSGARISTNSTRITFNYVRDNPGVMRNSAVEALARLGVPKGSSTSLLSVLVSRGNLRQTAEGALFAAQPEYKPLPKPKSEFVAPTPKAETPKTPEPAQTNQLYMDADTLLNHLSIKQARALYDELRKIFGG